MPIHVVCQSCRKSFKVSEKFAGKSGPCPNCKAVIQVPAKQEAVKVHAPTEFAEGGRSREGELITKPISRKYASLQPVAVAAVAAASLAVVLVAWALGKADVFDNPIAAGVGLLLIGPPLAIGGYLFVRDEEREPYAGVPLLIRATACAVVYALLWGVYGYVGRSMLGGELWEWMFVVPGFLAAGAFAPRLALDVPYGDGFFHYAFYVLVTTLLGYVAGLGWPWEIGGLSAM